MDQQWDVCPQKNTWFLAFPNSLSPGSQINGQRNTILLSKQDMQQNDTERPHDFVTGFYPSLKTEFPSGYKSQSSQQLILNFHCLTTVKEASWAQAADQLSTFRNCEIGYSSSISFLWWLRVFASKKKKSRWQLQTHDRNQDLLECELDARIALKFLWCYNTGSPQ